MWAYHKTSLADRPAALGAGLSEEDEGKRVGRLEGGRIGARRLKLEDLEGSLYYRGTVGKPVTHL
jgi:hypothetical protein